MRILKFIERNTPGFIAAITTIIVSLSQDAIKEILKNVFGASLSGLFYILGLLAVAAVVVYLIKRAVEPKPKDLVPPDAKPGKMKGLILLVGSGLQGKAPEETAARDAIQYHLQGEGGKPALRVCWLIASDKSYPYAVSLKEEFQRQRVDVRLGEKVDAFDLHATYRVVARIYREDLPRERLDAGETIADFTGATKPMSLGMVLACLQYDAPMQYMMGRQTGVATSPMLVKFEPRAHPR